MKSTDGFLLQPYANSNLEPISVEAAWTSLVPLQYSWSHESYITTPAPLLAQEPSPLPNKTMIHAPGHRPQITACSVPILANSLRLYFCLDSPSFILICCSAWYPPVSQLEQRYIRTGAYWHGRMTYGLHTVHCVAEQPAGGESGVKGEIFL